MKGKCHMQNSGQVILNRHSVDDLYNNEKAKDLMLSFVEHHK